MCFPAFDFINKEISCSAAPPAKSLTDTQPAWPPHRGKVPLQSAPMAAAPCHHSKDQPAPTHRGRDRLRRRRQRPSQVRSKTSRAHPCEASGALLLSNGGDRGRPCRMHPLAAPGALWVLSRAGKVPRPPAGGRNFPQEMDFLWMARKEASLLSSVSQGFASAEATKGLSARPLETFGALCC